MNKLYLQQKLIQKLSPQQIQVMKLLEIPSSELEDRVKRELEDNPVLEIAPIKDEPLESNYRYRANNSSRDDEQDSYRVPLTSEQSLVDHIKGQLIFSDNIASIDMDIIDYLVGSIDADGYIRRDIYSIIDDIYIKLGKSVDIDQLDIVIGAIQECEPKGVGATDLQECLSIQLREPSDVAEYTALQIIDQYFNEFSKKHYDRILSALDIDQDSLRAAINVIKRLNPKPGASFQHSAVDPNITIIPDFIIDIEGDEIIVSLNENNIPDMRVNKEYETMLSALKEERNRSETLSFVKKNIDSASWFISAIKQRQNTLMLVMTQIVNIQEEYFYGGDDSKLKPMILKDIADRIDLDISTVSRVTNSKYFQSHFGIYSLKSLFTEGIVSESGDEISTREIRRMIKEYIDLEDPKKPYTDSRLSELLLENDFKVARRTVAKYREQMGISVARLRKGI